jgi:hypothetical protein
MIRDDVAGISLLMLTFCSFYVLSVFYSLQVSLISSSRLIIGMHGAGHCLIAFHVQPHRAHLLELFRGKDDQPDSYINMASRIGMGYTPWVNDEPERNTDLETKLPIEKLVHMAEEIVEKLERQQ